MPVKKKSTKKALPTRKSVNAAIVKITKKAAVKAKPSAKKAVKKTTKKVVSTKNKKFAPKVHAQTKIKQRRRIAAGIIGTSALALAMIFLRRGKILLGTAALIFGTLGIHYSVTGIVPVNEVFGIAYVICCLIYYPLDTLFSLKNKK